MERNIAIDTLRTVSTLLVILLHISAEYVIKSMNDFTFDSSFWISNIVDSFSRICVPLFVLISGMFLVGRNETFEQSYQKRASRILIPLIAWTIIYLLYRMSISFVVSNIIDIKSLFVSVILGCPFYHMWYLFMIIGLYLITPLLNNSISKISRNNLWIVAILFLLFGMVNSCYDEFFNNNVFFMLWFINYLGYFILGYLIKDYKKRFPFYFLFSVYIISSILIAFLSLYTIKTYHNLFFYGYLTPFVAFGALSFYKLISSIEIGRKYIF